MPISAFSICPPENRPAAARNFTQALWLDPESETARQGLLESQQTAAK